MTELLQEEAQKEEQKATFPEIRDTADSYAQASEESDEAAAIDVDIDGDNMVWEVETEPADDSYREDAFSEEAYDSNAEEVYDDTPEEDHGYYGIPQEIYEEIPYARKINKNVFTWVLSCLCGMYGVDRFARGQVGAGILKLLTFGGFGIWYIADLAAAIYKSYIEPGAETQEDLHFDSYGRYV